MTQTSRELRTWVVANVLFVAALCGGLIPQLHYLSYVGYFVVWLMLVMYASMYATGYKGSGNPAPLWLCRSIDALAMAALLLLEAYATAAAYIVSMILLAMIYSRAAVVDTELDRQRIVNSTETQTGPQPLLTRVFNALPYLGMALVSLGMLAVLFGTPVLLLYEALWPLTQPDPMTHYVSYGITLLKIALFIGAVFGAISLVTVAASQFALVRRALRILGWTLVAIVVLGGVVQCVENPWGTRCTSSRYMDC